MQQRLALVRRDNATVAADLQGKAAQFEEVKGKPVLMGKESNPNPHPHPGPDPHPDPDPDPHTTPNRNRNPKPKPKPKPNPKPEQVLKGEEFRKYASELRGKTAQYKRMKQELAELRSEWGVLSRTQAILEGEAKKVAGSG